MACFTSLIHSVSKRRPQKSKQEREREEEEEFQRKIERNRRAFEAWLERKKQEQKVK